MMMVVAVINSHWCGVVWCLVVMEVMIRIQEHDWECVCAV